MKIHEQKESMVGPKPSRSLHGKSIYLDLFGYRNVVEFEKNLQLLGAVVEKCFSKDVSHVITNRATAVNSSQTRSASKNGTVEAAIASPLSLSPFAECGGHRSPFSISPTTADAASRPMTRGQAIVQKAMLSRKRGSTNVIECAQQWNIKVIHIDAAVKWMKKELGVLAAQKQTKKSKVMQLTTPYIKFEESCSRFCPEFKILAGFPALEFNGSHTISPFDQLVQPCSVENAGNQAVGSPHEKASADLTQDTEHHQIKAFAELSAKCRRKKPDKEKRKFTDRPDLTVLSSRDEQPMTAGELQQLKKPRIQAGRQKGFCEICDIKYDNMLQHLRTKNHKSYVDDVGNYEALDMLISQTLDQTTFQTIGPANKIPRVMSPFPTVSSEDDVCDLNLLALPSSSSSHFKVKVSPECSAFFWSGRNNGDVQAAACSTVQQNITNPLPKPQATVDETQPEEPGINYCVVEQTPNNSEKHSGFNEQKSCDAITNSTSFDQSTVNSDANVDSLGDLADFRCENLPTSKEASNTLRPDGIIPEQLESEASCKIDAKSVSSHIYFTLQSDNCELNSEEVSSEIPVSQSIRYCEETCKVDSDGIHVSAHRVQPITFALECCTMNSEEALSDFVVLQPPNCTDLLQSQLSYHTCVTGSPYECREHRHSSPLKRRKRCHSYMTDSPLKCGKLPLREVDRVHQESAGYLEKCFFDGCKSHKRKRIKFSQAVSVLTNRSVLELFESDTSSDFEGFTEANEQVIKCDLSYDEVSEAELSIDSDIEWASTSTDSILESHSADAETAIFLENSMASIAPTITSVMKSCTLSEADMKMAHGSESPITHSSSNQNVLTVADLSNLESNSELHFPNNTFMNFTGVFNCIRKDIPASATENYYSRCTSQQEDILTCIDKDSSEVLIKPLSLNENYSSHSIMKDESGLNQFSADNKSGSVMAWNVKLNQVPTNEKLPLTLTNAKITTSRSWQPVVYLSKCAKWERGCGRDKKEQVSVSDSHSALQDEFLTSRSSEVYSLVEASNGFRKLRRKLNFSHVSNEGQPSGLKEKTSQRKKGKCSAILKTVTSENMSASPMSNTDALCCNVEMPEITHVSDLIDLESNGEINVEEGLKEKKSLRKKRKCSAILKTVTSENMSASPMSNTDALFCNVEMPELTNVFDLVDLESNREINVEEVLGNYILGNDQKLCSKSSTVDCLNRNSVGLHFSEITIKHDSNSTFSEAEHRNKVYSNSTTTSGNITTVKSDKTLIRNINVVEIPMHTSDFTKISDDVRNANASCNLKARELMKTDKNFQEASSDSNFVGKMHFKFCYDEIQNNKLWQPVIILDRSSVKPNFPFPCPSGVSTSGRSDAEHVAKMSCVPSGTSVKPLSSGHSIFVLADAVGSEVSVSRNEVLSSDERRIIRSLVVLLNRCDSQLSDSRVDVSIQKMASTKAGLVEKQNLLDINNRDRCPANAISLTNHRKDVNVAVDFKGNKRHLQEDEVKDVGTLGCGQGASEKLTARICRSRTFENSNRLHNVGVNARKKLTDTDVNRRKTSGSDAVRNGCAEEPLEAVGRIGLPNSVLLRNSDVGIVSSDNTSNGESSDMNLESSEISDGQKCRCNIFSQLNRSLPRKYLDWSKPETYAGSLNSRLQWTSKTNSNECLDLFNKKACSSCTHRNRSFNPFLPRSKADWSKTSSVEESDLND